MLEPLRTAEGAARLAAATVGCPAIVAAWRVQDGRRCCGVASLAICATAAAPKGPPSSIAAADPQSAGAEGSSGGDRAGWVSEADVLELLRVRNGEGGVPTPDLINAQGLTLEQLELAAAVLPSVATATRFHCGAMDAAAVGGDGKLLATPDAMRDEIIAALSANEQPDGSVSKAVILNYDMDTLGQHGWSGHLSPIGGYHALTDSFLIADTWPETEPVWAPCEAVWRAACGVDGISARPRGLLVLEMAA